MNKENNKPGFLKRISAYLIDMIIVTLLSTIISMIFFNTNNNQGQAEQLVKLTELTSKYNNEKITKEEYDIQLNKLIEDLSKSNHEESLNQAITITRGYASSEITKEEYNNQMNDLIQKLTSEGVPIYSVQLVKLMDKYQKEEITREEFTEEYNILNYFITKENAPTSIILCAVSLIYYVILCYFCHGITLGKYLMKLRIVGNKEKELNMINYLIRSLLVNLILSNIVSVVFVLTMNQTTFINVYPVISNILTIFLLVTVIVMMYRNDGRGLHDILASTKVISTKELPIKEEVKEIVEAKVIEEKHEVKEKNKINKTTKKTTTKKMGVKNNERIK